jgi:hypothetical protein
MPLFRKGEDRGERVDDAQDDAKDVEGTKEPNYWGPKMHERDRLREANRRAGNPEGAHDPEGDDE